MEHMRQARVMYLLLPQDDMAAYLRMGLRMDRSRLMATLLSLPIADHPPGLVFILALRDLP